MDEHVTDEQPRGNLFRVHPFADMLEHIDGVFCVVDCLGHADDGCIAGAATAVRAGRAAIRPAVQGDNYCMVRRFLARMRQLVSGFTRVTFSGCGGDPRVYEEDVRGRTAARRAESARRQADAGSPDERPPSRHTPGLLS